MEECKTHRASKNEKEKREDEIQEIKNTLRRYDKERGLADSFWETFNSSRCKTAMLLISLVVVFVWGISVLMQIPNEELTVIVMGIVGFWSGRSSKKKDIRISE